MKNAEALADNENGYGWLWEKHWVDCYTAGSITVHSSGGGISAGTYAYNTTFLARVKELHLSVTVIEPGPGQKSYCYDGWSFCSEDDCR